MALYRLALGILVTLILVSCSIPKPDPAAEVLAKTFYTDVRDGRFDAAEKAMVAEARGDLLRAQLKQVQTLIPPGEPKAVTQQGWNVSAAIGQGASQTLVYAYDYGDRTTVSTVVMARKDNAPWQVRSFNVNTTLTSAPAQGGAPAVSGTGAEEPKKAP